MPGLCADSGSSKWSLVLEKLKSETRLIHIDNEAQQSASNIQFNSIQYFFIAILNTSKKMEFSFRQKLYVN
jgi:hypothetical protein